MIGGIRDRPALTDRTIRYGFLSTYPPTRCGLATFTSALASAMAVGGDRADVVRVDDLVPTGPALELPGITVVADLRPGDPESARASVAALNATDVVVVQHEFGIYGGRDGDEVVDVLRAISAPVIVVLHTVLDAPSPHQRDVLERVCAQAAVVVVMTEAARRTLAEHSSVPASKVHVIPHGVDGFAPAASVPSRRPTVLTWGLIGPGKGIEWGIRAIAELEPRPRYRVVGQTHPKVLAHEGDRYRDRMRAIGEQLGIADDIELDARHLASDELVALVGTADVVLLPYDSRDQVTSGVLVEALAAGKPVVATAFPHAVELLSGGAGIVVPHEDPHAIAVALAAILGDAVTAERMSAVALRSGAGTPWAEVGARYRTLSAGLLRSAAA